MLDLSRIKSRKIYKTLSSENKACIECASLNKSSLQSFATGDEDGMIKVWNIGDDECVSSFESTSNLSITCVGHTNNLLVSGNIGGGIKLYDLIEGKLLRNYNGHRCQITDINLFDNLIISASTDCNVKLWDIRSKTSIVTFKGHTNTVQCVDYSPDGSWIVSGDCVGHTKLWDFSTSKCLHQFHDKQPIHDISFHPEELVLAVASGKVVRFWDLESMKHIARTTKGTTPIKKIAFAVNTQHTNPAQYIVSASNQSLRVWQWDPLPVYCTNNVSVHWKNTISDMQQINGYNDLICLEIDRNKKSVVVWHSDLGSIYSNNNKACVIQEDDHIDQPEKDESYDDEFEEIDDEDIPLEVDDAVTKTFACSTKLNDDAAVAVPACLKNMPQQNWTQSFVEAVDIVRKQRKIKQIKHEPGPAFSCKKQLSRSPMKCEGTDTSNEVQIKENINLKFAQFIPQHLVDFDERELIKIKRTMMGDHIPTLKILSARLRYLRQLKSLWKKKKTNELMQLLQQIQSDDECENNTVFASFMQSLLKDISSKSLSFRFCYLLLSSIDLNGINPLDDHMCINILNYILFLLQTFASLICDTLKTEIINEKDISMVDRRQYCQQAHVLLTKNIKSFLLNLQNDINSKQKQPPQPNIKIEELCTKLLTLIETLN
eukprot:174573_1